DPVAATERWRSPPWRPGPGGRRAPRPAASCQLSTEYGQSPRLQPEPQAQVEGEGGFVAQLGVHNRTRRAPATHPVESVGGQSDAVPGALTRRMDREALQVALAGGAAGDGVGDNGVALEDD